MNGFIIFTTCLTDSVLFRNRIAFSEVKQLAVEIESSVLGHSINHVVPSARCWVETDKEIKCTWNASYSFNDCKNLRQSNLDARTLGNLEKYDITFCDVDIGCRK